MINFLLGTIIIIASIFLIVLFSSEIGHYEEEDVIYFGKKNNCHIISYNSKEYKISEINNKELYFLLSIRELKTGDSIRGTVLIKNPIFSDQSKELVAINGIEL